MLARLVILVLAAFVALNGVVLAVAHYSELGQHPLDVQTRGIYEERLAQLDEASAEIGAVVGDSVVFGAHLSATRGASWPRYALPGQLEQQLTKSESRRVAVLNLGVNGLLFRELNCVVRDVLARKPGLLFVNVSPRPFAADFERDGGESSRPFVCSNSFAGRTESMVRKAIPALRYRDLWQFEWLGNTPRAVARERISELFAGKPIPAPPKTEASNEQHDEDEEDEEDEAYVASLMWRFRAAQRLNSINVRPDHAQARDLNALLHAIRLATSTRVVMFYLHEDENALAGQLDVQRFRPQQVRFGQWIAGALQNASHAQFVELPSSDFQGEYVDHVHLTARGYALLAQRLIRALPREKFKRAAAH